jgi:polar amino acid transport system substrate-binding protein
MNKAITVVLAVVVVGSLTGLGFVFRGKLFPETDWPADSGKISEIKKRGELIVGTDATYPPMESIDQEGNIVGMDIDIAKEAASDMGVKAKFINIAWEQLFDAVKNGEVDIAISAITITKERTETLGFSDPYFNAGQVIVSTEDKRGLFKGPEDLKDYRVGVQAGTTSEQEAQKYSSSVKSYENYELAKDELLQGQIDAIVIDYPAAVGMVVQEPRLRMAGEIFTQEFYGIAGQKNQSDLFLQLNKTIRRLKREGGLSQIEQKWLSP